MSGLSAEAAALQAALEAGVTTIARAWSVARRDGVVLGFTDHDAALSFAGVRFAADGGMTAQALQAGNGLAVDNSEALGVLSHDAIRAEDLRAGRYDGAEVTLWEVNWADPAARRILFRGTLGEITEAGAAFRAELRGTAEALGQPVGRVFQRDCAAVLGDAACGVDLGAPGYRVEAVVAAAEDDRVLRFAPVAGVAAGWFTRGRVEVLDGAAAGLSGHVKADRIAGGDRVVELWQGLRAPVAAGDRVRLVAGCDKRAATCKAKFQNFSNFRGFPHLPSEDWLMSYPAAGGVHDGGAL